MAEPFARFCGGCGTLLDAISTECPRLQDAAPDVVVKRWYFDHYGVLRDCYWCFCIHGMADRWSFRGEPMTVNGADLGRVRSGMARVLSEQAACSEVTVCPRTRIVEIRGCAHCTPDKPSARCPTARMQWAARAGKRLKKRARTPDIDQERRIEFAPRFAPVLRELASRASQIKLERHREAEERRRQCAVLIEAGIGTRGTDHRVQWVPFFELDSEMRYAKIRQLVRSHDHVYCVNVSKKTRFQVLAVLSVLRLRQIAVPLEVLDMFWRSGISDRMIVEVFDTYFKKAMELEKQERESERRREAQRLDALQRENVRREQQALCEAMCDECGREHDKLVRELRDAKSSLFDAKKIADRSYQRSGRTRDAESDNVSAAERDLADAKDGLRVFEEGSCTSRACSRSE